MSGLPYNHELHEDLSERENPARMQSPRPNEPTLWKAHHVSAR
jgi:hypothetical protein